MDLEQFAKKIENRFIFQKTHKVFFHSHSHKKKPIDCEYNTVFEGF